MINDKTYSTMINDKPYDKPYYSTMINDKTYSTMIKCVSTVYAKLILFQFVLTSLYFRFNSWCFRLAHSCCSCCQPAATTKPSATDDQSNA